MVKRNIMPSPQIESEDEDVEEDEEEDDPGVPGWDAVDPYLDIEEPSGQNLGE